VNHALGTDAVGGIAGIVFPGRIGPGARGPMSAGATLGGMPTIRRAPRRGYVVSQQA